MQLNEVKRLQDKTLDIQGRLNAVEQKKKDNLEGLEEQRNTIIENIKSTSLSKDM